MNGSARSRFLLHLLEVPSCSCFFVHHGHTATHFQFSMLSNHPPLSKDEMTQRLPDARPSLDGSTEVLAFTDAALIPEQAQSLGISKDVSRFLERLALAVDVHHPWPREARKQEPLPAVIAGCGVVDSSSEDGQLPADIPAAGMDGGSGTDTVAVVVPPTLPPSVVDPALTQESLLVKAFPYGWEVSMPDVGETLDGLRRQVLDEIQDLCLLTRFRQLVTRLRGANELENVRPLERELLTIVQRSEACAQELSQLAWYPWRRDSDPDFKKFVEGRGVHFSNK